MSSTTLYHWSGIVLLVGSALGVIVSIMSLVLYPGHTLTPQQVLSSSWTLAASLFLVWALLVVMSLPGLYLRQATGAGRLGFVGFVLLSLGVLLGGVLFGGVQVTDYPYLAQLAPKLLPSGDTGPDAGFVLWILGPTLLLGIGAILFGIATRRATVFPRSTGMILIISGVLFLLSIPPIPSPLGDIIDLASNLFFFVALAWCGYLLMTQKQTMAEVVTHPVAEAGVSR